MEFKGKLQDFEGIPGAIVKSAEIMPVEVTEDDMKKINQYSLSPLEADQVFVFKNIIADNEQDDRNFAPFDLASLHDMAELYPGKTVLTDHRRSANNQIGRVYSTELQTVEGKTTELGEPYTQLIAKVYMVKTESNKDLIAEINGGIKKEVSTSCAPKSLICNICGQDNIDQCCKHYPGVTYSKNGEDTTCKTVISGVKEAYELSLVAVPAQPRAGACKHVAEYQKEDIEDFDTATRLRVTESFNFVQKQEVENQ